jgi:hypothetical protein
LGIAILATAGITDPGYSTQDGIQRILGEDVLDVSQQRRSETEF